LLDCLVRKKIKEKKRQKISLLLFDCEENRGKKSEQEKGG